MTSQKFASYPTALCASAIIQAIYATVVAHRGKPGHAEAVEWKMSVESDTRDTILSLTTHAAATAIESEIQNRAIAIIVNTVR